MTGLVGTWRLLACHLLAPAGQVVARPFGDRPDGLLVYTSEGRVSVHLTGGGITAPPPDRAAAITAEGLAAGVSYVGYFGTYESSGDEVMHHIEASSILDWAGTCQTRTLAFAQDTMTLSPPPMAGGIAPHLVWRRLSA
ncbi:lipocalin-like domain-containing protein [Streptomyces sp. IBSNAI002]|uniref:lipocalin-like domain-containing protein n=1 Tax=Streptomyces sp. IBSNAI002 TaxID=3457500 RepID=UPI003FD36665